MRREAAEEFTMSDPLERVEGEGLQNAARAFVRQFDLLTSDLFKGDRGAARRANVMRPWAELFRERLDRTIVVRIDAARDEYERRMTEGRAR